VAERAREAGDEPEQGGDAQTLSAANRRSRTRASGPARRARKYRPRMKTEPSPMPSASTCNADKTGATITRRR